MNIDPIEITGLTLIDKAIDIERMIVEKPDWTFERQKDNPPRLIRLKQLEVLLKLFTPETYDVDIEIGIKKLFNGDFILHREIKKYANVFAIMENAISLLKPSFRKESEWESKNLRFNYHYLMGFKREIDKIKCWNNGILEIDYKHLYQYVVTSEFINGLCTKSIDDFLSLVIDPLGRTFTKDELIQDFNYPKEDIFDVDIDWL